MKKPRRSKTVKDALTNFKIFYQNVRGLKSKVESLMELISHYQPISWHKGNNSTVTKRRGDS